MGKGVAIIRLSPKGSRRIEILLVATVEGIA